MRVWLAGLAVAFSCGLATASPGYFDAQAIINHLNECLAHWSPETSYQSAPTSVAEACPELKDQLLASPLAELAKLSFDTEIVPDDLWYLRLFANDYLADQSAATPPDIGSLETILAEMTFDTAASQLSLWERFRGWLAQWLQQDDQWRESAFAAWLNTLELPVQLFKYVLFGCMAIILILAVWIIYQELAAAGIFFRRRSLVHPKPSQLAQEARADHPVLTPEQIAALPIAKQPPALLRAALDYLRRRSRVPADASLTNTELCSHLAQQDSQAAESLQQLAYAAERTMFGVWRPTSVELVPIGNAWRLLHDYADQNPAESTPT